MSVLERVKQVLGARLPSGCLSVDADILLDHTASEMIAVIEAAKALHRKQHIDDNWVRLGITLERWEKAAAKALGEES